MKSSLKLGPATPIGKEQDKKLTLIVNFLYESNDAVDFREPVDWRAMQILDYPSIIKHPMDLGTVKDKFTSKNYASVQEVLDDIQLVWDNCKAYNKSGWFHDLADKMERAFKKMVKNYLPNINIVIPSKNPAIQPQSNQIYSQKEKQPPKVEHHQSIQRQHNSRKARTKISQLHIEKQQVQQSNEEPEIEEIPQSEKIRFHQRLKKITQQQLAKIVMLIQENCNDAWREMQKGRCQILIDAIDIETFKKINEKLDEFLQVQDKVSKKVKV